MNQVYNNGAVPPLNSFDPNEAIFNAAFTVDTDHAENDMVQQFGGDVDVVDENAYSDLNRLSMTISYEESKQILVAQVIASYLLALSRCTIANATIMMIALALAPTPLVWYGYGMVWYGMV